MAVRPILFPILEPQSPSIGWFYLVRKRGLTYFEALILENGRSCAPSYISLSRSHAFYVQESKKEREGRESERKREDEVHFYQHRA